MVPSGQSSPASPADQSTPRSGLAKLRPAPAPAPAPGTDTAGPAPATAPAAEPAAAARAVGIAALALGDLTPDPQWRRPVLLDTELLVLVTGGHGTVEVDFRPLPCRPGTLLRTRPGQVLRCLGAALDAVVLRWTPAALPRDPALDVDDDGVVPTYRQLTGEDGHEMLDEVTRLAVDVRRQPDVPAARALLRHRLAVLLLRLTLLSPTAPNATARAAPDATIPTAPDGTGAVDTTGAGRSRAENRTFQQLCHAVERGYRHTRRVEDYAALIGCSVRTLTRACLAVTGRSAKQVIDERVALEASRLLAATDEPIAQIGRRLGFPEPTNFGRFFTREAGVSPGAFRAARGRPAPRTATAPGPAQPQPATAPAQSRPATAPGQSRPATVAPRPRAAAVPQRP
ncbi:helix-turn-helix domain-containing protein [Micromonospora sp. DT233]|uniref:helix-turn-helix domain-containing protein n=1 Tax=Micromonospora sp. DT233 TaxID=3393432 RepID=UPI003CF13FB6